MRNEQGLTLVELLTVVAVSSVMALTTVAYSVPWMAKQTLNASIYDVQAMLQLTKVEAVSRNRECRFVVDTASGRLSVRDTMGTTTLADDVILHDRLLPTSISFLRPDTGSVVTMGSTDSIDTYHAVFDSIGIVSSGTGAVHLNGGESFGRIALEAAGGVGLSHWDGTEWSAGI